MDLRDPVARMLNTCLIGRGWKSREGWSRPVLTGDGDTTFQPVWVGSASFLCWIVDDIEHCPWSLNDFDKRFVSRLLAGSRTATGSSPVGVGAFAGMVPSVLGFPFRVFMVLRWSWPR